MNRDDDSDIARLFARFGGDPDTYQEIAVAVVTESPTDSAEAASHAQPGPAAAEAAVTVAPAPFMDSNPLRRLSARRETGMGSQCLPDLFKRLLSL